MREKHAENLEHSEWYHCSDSYVHRVTEKDVLAAQAYMLFYERIY
jgi:ubiquitin C-terminal hydrolase